MNRDHARRADEAATPDDWKDGLCQCCNEQPATGVYWNGWDRAENSLCDDCTPKRLRRPNAAVRA